jgi:hypothetical protein
MPRCWAPWKRLRYLAAFRASRQAHAAETRKRLDARTRPEDSLVVDMVGSTVLSDSTDGRY